MTSTRRQVRQAALDEDLVWGAYGTATGGSATTLVDTSGPLGSVGDAVSKFASAYIYRPAAANTGDYYRRANPDGYTPSTQTVTHGGPNYTVNPLAGADNGYYEMWRWDPRQINRAFSRALTRQVFTIERDDIVTTGGSLYDFSATPFSAIGLTSVDQQILDIGVLSGTDPNSHVFPWNAGGRSWAPENDGSAVKIRFSTPPTGTLRVTWKKPLADITDETTTTAVDRTWIMWAMLFEFAKSSRQRALARQESPAAFEAMELYCAQQMDVRRKMYMDRFGAQVIAAPTRWRSPAPAPRMGRRGNLTVYASRNVITP